MFASGTWRIRIPPASTPAAPGLCGKVRQGCTLREHGMGPKCGWRHCVRRIADVIATCGCGH
eukprot:6479620-Pyramimonas_sp.AAC.1